MLPVLLTAACAVETGHLTCKADTDAGKAVVMTFATASVQADENISHEATVCTVPARPLTAAKLWMPEHGHGSARTRLAPEGDCTKVTRIVFTMSGNWEIRLTLEDNDAAVIHVAVP